MPSLPSCCRLQKKYARNLNIMVRFRRSLLAQRISLPLLGAAVLFIIVSHWAKTGQLIQGGDNFFGYDPSNGLSKGFFAWNRFGLYIGAPWSSATWTPWLTVVLGLKTLSGLHNAQVVTIWLALEAGWLGLYLLARTFGISQIGAFFAATLYTLNPWNQLFAGLNYPLNWLTATAPWIAYFILVGARRPEKRGRTLLALAAFSFAVLPVLGANPALVILISVCAVLTFLLGALYMRPTAFWQYAQWCATAAAVSFVASLWWLYVIVLQFLGNQVVATASAQDWTFVVSRSSLLNNMRLNAIWGWAHPEYFPYAKGYDSNILEYSSGYLMLVAAALALYFSRTKRKRRVAKYCLGVSLVAFFISKGLHSPLVGLNAAFYHLPLSALFRESTSKTPVIALLFLSPLLGSVLDAVSVYSQEKFWPKLAAPAVASVAILTAAFPMVTGSQFHGYTLNFHRNVPGLPSQYVALPNYWQRATSYLNELKADGAVLVLPAESYYQVDYSWGLYGADYLPTWSIHRDILIPGLEGYTASPNMRAIDHAIVNNFRLHASLTATILRRLGIRYVLFRGDVRHDIEQPGNISSQDVEGTLKGSASPSIFGPLRIYDLGDALPDLRLSSSFNEGDYSTFDAGAILTLDALTENVPRVDKSSLLNGVSASPLFIESNISGRMREQIYVGTNMTESQRRTIGTGIIPRQDIALRSGAHDAEVSIVTSFAGADPANDTYFVPYRSFTAVRRYSGTLMVNPNDVYTDETGVMHLNLPNPTSKPITVPRLRVGVLSAEPAEWLLAGAVQQKIATLGADTIPQWAFFDNVTLYPGINRFILTSERLNNVKLHTPESHGIRVGDVHIDGEVKANSIGTDCAGYFEPCSVRSIGTVAINTPLFTAPIVTLRSIVSMNESTYVMAMIHMRNGHVPLLCASDLGNGVALDVFSTATRCLTVSGDAADRSAIVVDSVSFVFFDLQHSVPVTQESFGGATLARRVVTDPSIDLQAPSAFTGETPLAVLPVAEGYEIDVPRTVSVPARSLLGEQVLVQLPESHVIRGKLIRRSIEQLQIQQTDGSILYVPTAAIQVLTGKPTTLRLAIHWRILGKIRPGSMFVLSIKGHHIDSGQANLRYGKAKSQGYLTVADDQQSASVVMNSNVTRAIADGGMVSAEFEVGLDQSSDSNYVVRLDDVTPQATGGVFVSSGQDKVLLSSGEHAALTARLPWSELLSIKSADPSLEVIAIGKRPCLCSYEKPLGNIGRFGSAVVNVPKDASFITSDFSASGAWAAVRVSHPFGLLRAINMGDGTQGWYSDQAGEILIINAANVIQILLIAAGLVMLVLQVRRAV